MLDGIIAEVSKLSFREQKVIKLAIEPIEEVIRVLNYGAKKYPEADNWKRVHDIQNRYYSACLRHLTAWKKGEIKDQESGLHHLAHAICCLIFILWKEAHK